MDRGIRNHSRGMTSLIRGIGLLTFLFTANAASDYGPSHAPSTDGVESARASSESEKPLNQTISTLPTICLSPGHPSFAGDKYFEAVINRKVAYYLQDVLEQYEYSVVMSTTDIPKNILLTQGAENSDETLWQRLEVMSPEEKAKRCNNASADYVISIHHNFAYNDDINQTLVFYGADNNYEAAYAEAEVWAKRTARQLGKVMHTDSSKTFADMNRLGFPLGIMVHSNAPAILTEGSFYSHPAERKRLSSDMYLQNEAQAIFDAFHAHYQSVERN